MSTNGQSNGHCGDEASTSSSVQFRSLAIQPEEVPISVDLVTAAEHELAFLHLIQQSASFLCRDDVVRNAIRRYETVWLPLKAQERSVELVAPLDVHWVWHCHMLSPIDYARDCDSLIGHVIDHEPISLQQMDTVRAQSIQMWNRRTGEAEPWLYTTADEQQMHQTQNYRQKSGYNILAAVQRQRAFIYQISLPHYASRKFLEAALERYRKFLCLLKTYSGEFLTPCYDFDLIWHTHQLHPSVYHADCRRLTGSVLNHDDSTTERAAGTKLATGQSHTTRLWSHHFGDSCAHYQLSGAMYRGHAAPYEFGMDVQDLSDINTGIIRIFSIDIENVRLKREGLKMRVNYETRTLSTIRAQSDSKEEITKLHFNMLKQPVDVKFSFDRRCPGTLSVTLELFNRTLGRKTQRTRVIGRLSLYDLLPEPGSEEAEKRTNMFLSISGPTNGEPIQQQARIQVRTLLTLDVKVRLVVNDFKETPLVSGSQLERLCHATALNKDITFTTVTAAMHSIIDFRGNEMYSVQVVHSVTNRLSLILVRDANGALLAKAHLVSNSCVPAIGSIERELQESIPTLEHDSQQTVLVSDGNGDITVLVGKWIGFQKRVPANEALGQRGAPGNPGKLQVSEYDVVHKRLVRTFELPSGGRSMRYNVGVYAWSPIAYDVSDACAQLSHINMQIRSVRVAESLASVFGVATLFLLCNPDKVRTKDDDLTLRGYMCRNWPLAVACGYGQDVPSQRIIRQDSVHTHKTESDTVSITVDNDNLSTGLGVGALVSAASCCACGSDGAAACVGSALLEKKSMDILTMLEPGIGAAILEENTYQQYFADQVFENDSD